MHKILIPFLILCGFQANGQLKNITKSGVPATTLKTAIKPSQSYTPSTNTSLQYSQIGKLNQNSIQNPIKTHQVDKNKQPILIKGWLEDYDTNMERQAKAYLSEIASLYRISDPSEEWEITEIIEDEIGMHHIKVAQVLNNVPVFSGEIILHARNGRIETVMGRGFPSPKLNTSIPTLNKRNAEKVVQERLEIMDHYVAIPPHQIEFFKMQQVKLDLVIYHENDNAEKERLAYFVQAYENLGSYNTYFIDAHDGSIIHEHSNICKFHGDHLPPPDGPATATAQDLNGVTRTIDTYEASGDFFMINATKPNFSASQSTFPNGGVGVIMTLDAQNKSPQQSDFSYFHVANNDNNSWNDRSSVSAHYNANIAYDYFKEVHSRNAIDGGGGNVLSIINVTDEDENSMDNAYWNGIGMYYGNGNTEFLPLAGGLDVAGHEMSHGVVQTTANLNYENESGALNESFADVFGVMMDRDDYKLGEDVVTSSFPTGALRDLADPHNGGSKLGDRGWQPKNTNEQYFGSQDNGGVHINSGIPNHAFFLFAETVGKDKAELIYYRALTQYLTRSSRFVDCRNAVVQSAEDLYGSAEADAAKNAFSQVGIGEGTGGDYTNDAVVNEGMEFLIYADKDQSKLAVVNASLETILDPASESAPFSVPSISDDGSLIYYVNSDNQIASTIINWDENTVNTAIVQDQQIWSNVVISKDGNRMAAVELAQSDRIQIFDFNKGEWYTDASGNLGFQLYNPTFTAGVSTGDAKFADAMEFDISGEVLMFDVYSEIKDNFGQTIGYWDIGFLDAWDNSSNDWSDGQISKLFSALSEGISVGNPAFSKNSPYIIAFDYIENSEYAIIGANVETGDLQQIFENSSLGYPSFSGNDGQLIFTNETTFDTDVFLINLEDSKIRPEVGSEGLVIADAKWGVVFRNGTRVLSDVNDINENAVGIDIFPNPASEQVYLDMDLENSGAYLMQVFTSDGQLISERLLQLNSGSTRQMINIAELPTGLYSVKLSNDEKVRIGKFAKQ